LKLVPVLLGFLLQPDSPTLSLPGFLLPPGFLLLLLLVLLSQRYLTCFRSSSSSSSALNGSVSGVMGSETALPIERREGGEYVSELLALTLGILLDARARPLLGL